MPHNQALGCLEGKRTVPEKDIIKFNRFLPFMPYSDRTYNWPGTVTQINLETLAASLLSLSLFKKYFYVHEGTPLRSTRVILN